MDHLEVTKILLNAGPDMEALDNEQKLPMAYAQEHGNDEVVRYLTRLEQLQERPNVTLAPKDDAPPTHIWSDAICIDQTNDDERSHQVRLMRKIYEATLCVSIWLGTPDILTPHAIEAVNLIAAHHQEFATSDIIPYFHNDAHVYNAAGIQEISKLQWNAPGSLYLRKWFSRAWIVQETVLARQILLLFQTWMFECEDPRDKICSLLGLAISDADAHKISPDYIKPADEVYMQVTRYIFTKSKDLRMLNNISDSARDKRLPNLPSWVPDFSTTGVSAMYGTHYNAAGARVEAKLLPLPADWRRLAATGTKLGSVAKTGESYEGSGTHFRFDPAWFRMTSNLNATCITGEDPSDVPWRTLCLNQDVLEDVRSAAEFKDRFRQFVCALICAGRDSTKAEKSASTNVAYTLLGLLLQLQGMDTEEAERSVGFIKAVNEMKISPDPRIHGPNFDSIRDSLLLLDELARAHPNSALPTLDDIDDFRKDSKWQLYGGKDKPEGYPHVPKDNRFMLMVGTRYHRRRLFRTKENHSGLGPHSLQVGDRMWILGGTIFPFTLQPLEGGAYRLVGTAYVHGIMYGEASTSETVFEIELE